MRPNSLAHVLIAFLLSTCTTVAAEQPPNVVLIFADDKYQLDGALRQKPAEHCGNHGVFWRTLQWGELPENEVNSGQLPRLDYTVGLEGDFERPDRILPKLCAARFATSCRRT